MNLNEPLGIFIQSFPDKRIAIRLFLIFLIALVFLVRLKENEHWTKRARKNEIEEKPQLWFVKQAYGYRYTHFSSFLTLDKYRFSFRERERRVPDDSTNNITPGHCGVFLLFFLPLISIRYIPDHKLVFHDIFTLGHPQVYLLLLLLFFFCQFFLVGRWYNETGLLVIFPATVCVCFSALRSLSSNLLYFNHPSGFFALSRGWTGTLGLKYLSIDGAVEFLEIASAFLVAFLWANIVTCRSILPRYALFPYYLSNWVYSWYTLICFAM